VTRPSFDDIAFQLTEVIAQRSTCPRLHVAAVIMTPDNRFVSGGYNGSLPGQPHCDEQLCVECSGTGEIIVDGSFNPLTLDCDICNGTGLVGNGCIMESGHCIRTVHSEANAIAYAAKYGVSVNGCKMYVLAQPCISCAKLVISSGITEIIYRDKYRDDEDKVQQLFRSSNLMVRYYAQSQTP
jgi:dCMP deaminase